MVQSQLMDTTLCCLSFPHMLALSIAHWLPTAHTLPDFDLCCVELDINDIIWRTRCDCNINVYILFFLTFFIKLLFWRWKLISHLFTVFWWQSHSWLCLGKSQYITIVSWCLILPSLSRPTTWLSGSRPSWFSGPGHSTPDGSDSVLLLMSTSLSGIEDGMGEEYFFCVIVGSGLISIVRKCKFILYNFLCC